MKENDKQKDAMLSTDLFELAMISWAIKKYADKLVQDNNLENKSRPLYSNIVKLTNFLKNAGVEIIDYTGQKYNESMNIDVIDTIKSDVREAIIKETVEPTILYDNKLIKRARIIKEINRSCNE